MAEAGSRTANLIGMAKSAELAGNGQEAIDYYNRVLEDDPGVSEAWLGKGRAAGRMSSLATLRISETVVAFGHAMASADPAHRQATANQAIGDLVDIAEAVHGLAWNHHWQFPTVDSAWTMCVNADAALLDALYAAREWDPYDRRPLELTVAICKAMLDQGVSDGFADFLRERREDAITALRSIDQAYEPPALAEMSVADRVAAEVNEAIDRDNALNETHAMIGMGVLVLLVIVGVIIGAQS